MEEKKSIRLGLSIPLLLFCLVVGLSPLACAEPCPAPVDKQIPPGGDNVVIHTEKPPKLEVRFNYLDVDSDPKIEIRVFDPCTNTEITVGGIYVVVEPPVGSGNIEWHSLPATVDLNEDVPWNPQAISIVEFHGTSSLRSADPQEGIPHTIDNVRHDTYSEDYSERIRAYVLYAPPCDKADLSTYSHDCVAPSVATCDPEMCNDNAHLVCTAGKCNCEYNENYLEHEMLDGIECFASDDDQAEGATQRIHCWDPRSKFLDHCADGKFWTYNSQYFIINYWWADESEGLCDVVDPELEGCCDVYVEKECGGPSLNEPYGDEIEPNTYILFFESDKIHEDRFLEAELDIYTPYRKFRVKPMS